MEFKCFGQVFSTFVLQLVVLQHEGQQGLVILEEVCDVLHAFHRDRVPGQVYESKAGGQPQVGAQNVQPTELKLAPTEVEAAQLVQVKGGLGDHVAGPQAKAVLVEAEHLQLVLFAKGF